MRKTLAMIAVVGLFVVACGGAAASPTVKPEESEAPAATQAAGAATGRTVDLEIAAGKITPASVEVTKGETITFNAKNVSNTAVELIVGIQKDVDSDSGDSLKEAEEIAPGTSKTVSYTFDGAGPFAFGDQVGDHYAAGAKGVIVVKP
jgi:uncharacterized cupredoxin-like copper-binding protein